MIERVVVIVEISYEEIKFAVVIVVPQSNPHAALLAAIFIDGGS